MAQDENLRRITVSNDDGDVYVESSGDGSEIVLKTEKVRVDGDVYCEGSQVGLSARIDAVFPPKCVRPGGDKLQYDGSEWLCICNGAFGGETCETTWTPEARIVNVSKLELDDRYMYYDYHSTSERAHKISAHGDEMLVGGARQSAMILKRSVDSSSQTLWTPVWNFSLGYSWFQASNRFTWSTFGDSVALDGDLALIGAPEQQYCLFVEYEWCGYSYRGPGYAAIFSRVGSTDTWTLEANLTASDTAYEEWRSYSQNYTAHAQIRFGRDVALSGSYALISSSYVEYSQKKSYYDSRVTKIMPGAAYLFKRDESTLQWTEQAKLVSDLGNTTNDGFGQSIDLSDDYAVVGAVQDNEKGSNAGAVYVFKRVVATGSAETWERDAKLTASDASSDDMFGFRVSVSGDNIFVGSPYDDENGSQSGSVYVFKRDASTNAWKQTAKLTASNAAPNDQFGYSVEVNGDRALVGAPYKASAFGGSGVVYVFERDLDTGEWIEMLVKITDFKGLKSHIGEYVALSADYAVGASVRDDGGSVENEGFVVIANVSSIP